MIILTSRQLRKLLKETYEKGLNTGDNIGYQRRMMDEKRMGTIMPGYDMNKDLEEILKQKGWR